MPELSLDPTGDSVGEWLTPDVLVCQPEGFREKPQNRHVLPPLFLAVEILSPKQTFINLRWKAKEYITWGVEHVWFVDGDSKAVLTYDAPVWGRGQLYSEGTIAVRDFLEIPLQALFD